MTTYTVGFWYTEYGTTTVTAETPEEAEAKVQEHLADEGLPLDYKCNDREYGAQDAQEVQL